MVWPPPAQSAQNEGGFMNGGISSGGSGGGGHERREEHKVYAANIPLTMAQESVEALFAKYGHVTSARVLPPKDGRNSTVAFIGYATEDAALEAIDKLTGCELGEGPPLRVCWPANKNKQQSGQGGGSGGCHKCGQDGHFARECPNQQSQGGGRGCHKCGQEGHFARECPNQQSQGGGRGCHKCGQEGHFARECPNQQSQDGGRGCHKCGQEGHFARECPNQGGSSFGGSNNQQSPFSRNRDNNQQTPFGNSQPPQQSPFAKNRDTQQPQQSPFARNRDNQQNQQSPFGSNQAANQSQQSSFARNTRSQPQRSPFSGSNQNIPQSSSSLPNVVNQQANQTASFMTLLGRGESTAPATATRPGGLQGYHQQPYQQSQYQQPQHQSYQQPQQQSYQQPQHQSHQQPGNDVYHQQSQNVPQPLMNQGYNQGYQQGPNQSYPQQNSYPQQSQQYNSYQEPSESHQQPSDQGYQQGYQSYQNASTQGYQQAPNSSWGQQQDPSQGHQQVSNQGYGQSQPQSSPSQTFQQNQSYGHQHDQPQQQQSPQEYQSSQKSPFSSSNGPTSSGSPFGSKPSPFQRNDSQASGGSFSGRLPQSASQSSTERGTGGGRTCHKCGEEGHFARECPQAGGGGGGGRKCFKCGEEGHMSRECPSQQGTGSGRGCHKCGDESHFARDCPNQLSGGSTCHKCGEVGHFARECPTGGGQGGSCHRCGEMGHFARECPNVPPDEMDANRAPPVTYVPPELPDSMDALFEDAPHSGIKFDNYDNIPFKVSGDNPPPNVNSFDELGFGSQIMTNIRRAHYVKPTPVQKAALPIGLTGRDLMACAQTGSGKTAAFMLPVLTNLINQGLNAPPRSPLALCISPTRELATQIHKEARKFADGTPVKVALCYGGVNVAYQSSQVERGCHFLVATPGRLQDFVSREKVYLGCIRHLILDEADRMLDLGFGPAIEKLVEHSGMTPKESRQTLMFSATFPDEIQRLAGAFLKPDYLFLAVGRVGGTNLDITQHVIVVNGNDKRDKLHEILSASGNDRTLVFVELKRVADFLAAWLSQNNFPTTSISSDRSQMEREAALRDFREGRAHVCVATSVAARGLDIPDVKHVINYDLPQEIDEYVHRIGRTGRIGNEGKATAFYEIGRDDRLARSLVKVLSEAFQEVPNWLDQAAEEAVGSNYGPAGGRYSSRDHRERGGGGRSRFQGNVQDATSRMSNMQISSSEPASFQAPRQLAQPHGANGDNDEDWD